MLVYDVAQAPLRLVKSPIFITSGLVRNTGEIDLGQGIETAGATDGLEPDEDQRPAHFSGLRQTIGTSTEYDTEEGSSNAS